MKKQELTVKKHKGQYYIAKGGKLFRGFYKTKADAQLIIDYFPNVLNGKDFLQDLTING